MTFEALNIHSHQYIFLLVRWVYDEERRAALRDPGLLAQVVLHAAVHVQGLAHVPAAPA